MTKEHLASLREVIYLITNVIVVINNDDIIFIMGLPLVLTAHAISRKLCIQPTSNFLIFLQQEHPLRTLDPHNPPDQMIRFHHHGCHQKGDLWSGAMRRKLDLPVYEKGSRESSLQRGVGHD